MLEDTENLPDRVKLWHGTCPRCKDLHKENILNLFCAECNREFYQKAQALYPDPEDNEKVEKLVNGYKSAFLKN